MRGGQARKSRKCQSDRLSTVHVALCTTKVEASPQIPAHHNHITLRREGRLPLVTELIYAFAFVRDA